MVKFNENKTSFWNSSRSNKIERLILGWLQFYFRLGSECITVKMFQKINICFAILCALTGFSRSDDQQKIKDVLNFARANYWEELGCKQKGGSSGFDCPVFNQTLRTDKCFFNGVEYEAGTTLETEETLRMCVAACSCRR